MKSLVTLLGLGLGLSLLPANAQGTPPLKLEAFRELDGRLRLRSASAGSFTLEETDSITPPVQWRAAAVTTDPATTPPSFLLQPAAEVRFYRLRSTATALTTLLETSPADGEDGVAVTRETVLRFSQPLAANTVLTANQLHAEAAGRRILSRIELAGDRRTATLFYLEDLPGAARVRVRFDATNVRDANGAAIDANGDGLAGGLRVIEFNTFGTAPIANTAVIGRVFASELVAGPDTGASAINRPLEGVTITVDGAEETLRTTTDAMGNFKLEPSPAGRFFVHVDGRTAKGSAWPNGAYYPFVGKAWEATPGSDMNLAGGTGEIFLPLITVGTLQSISATVETTIQFPAEVVRNNPALDGVAITVPPNALLGENGVRGGKVGIAPVPPDRLPEKLPPGFNFPLVITVQTDGPANFDQPVPVRFPNLPDPITGLKLPPGAKSALWSFDHDTGRWEIQGPMTVSADGKFVESDPGEGIRQPGWHGTQPGSGGGGPPGPPTPPPQCPGPGGLSLAGNPALQAGGGNCGLGRFQCQISCTQGAIRCFFVEQACQTVCSKSLEYVCAYTGPFSDLVCHYLEKWICEPVCPQIEVCVQEANDCSRNCRIDYDTCLKCNMGPGVSLAGRHAARLSADDPELINATAFLGNVSATVAAYRALERRAVAVLGPFKPGQQPTADQIAQLVAIAQEADPLMGGVPVKQFVDDALERVDADAVRLNQKYPVFSEEQGFYVLDNLDTKTITRGRTGIGGAMSNVLLAPESNYQLQIYLPVAGVLGESRFISAASGRRTRIPGAGTVPDQGLDADLDGLGARVEFVLGTDADKADTDGDGVPDGAEVREGADPNSGLAVATGVIATSDTPGNAIDLAALNDLVLVADAEAGVSVFNVFNGLTPVLVAQVDTGGRARRVASNGRQAIVAAGAAGAAIIDLANPSGPVKTFQIATTGEAQAVAAAGAFGYVGTRAGQVVTVDLTLGAALDHVRMRDEIHDLAVEGGFLYCLQTDRLDVFQFFPDGSLEFRGTSPKPSFFSGNIDRLRRLFVGGQRAYVTSYPGYDVFDVSNPAAIKRLGEARDTTVNSFKQIVLNGSGLGFAAVGPVPSEGAVQDVALYDTSRPENTSAFLASFATPGAAWAVALNNGLGYAADGRSGLQVINYLARDTRGRAPTISLRASFPLSSGAADENTQAVVVADAADDVQVRNVEFYIDGVKTLSDGNYPFEYRFTVPSISATRPRFTVRAKAIDTGGRETWSEAFNITLRPDGSGPRVRRVDPSNDRILGSVTVLSAVFDEPLAPASVTAADVSLREAGPDRILGTADDAAVTGGSFVHTETARTISLTFAAPLAPGFYELEIGPTITDLAGNPMAASSRARFHVIPGEDSDQDGVPDDLETALGLDKTKTDTNNDGELDGEEDSDRDGISNAVEAVFGTDPAQADTDGDGIKDGDEDRDGDSLPDVLEFFAGTSPTSADSDGDGWNDEAEITTGSDPLDPRSTPRISLVAVPLVELLRATLGEAGGLPLNTIIAHPDVELVLPTFGSDEGFLRNAVIARPAVELILPVLGTATEPRNTTLALPPVRIERK